MPSVQFGGLITGLDTNSLIAGLVKAEQGPTNLLQSQKAKLQAQQSAYTTLTSSLGKLRTAAQSLSLSSDFSKRSSDVSDPTVLSASVDSTAQTGVAHIVVDTLAKAQSIRSTSFASSTAAIGTGKLTIAVGSTSTEVTIDGTNNSLTGLKEAINNSSAAVTASIVNVGPTGAPDFRVVIQGKNTGTANAVTVSSSLSSGPDPFALGGEVVQAATDAVFSVDGLKVKRSSNTVSDVLPGVTLVLRKEGNRDGNIDAADPSTDVTVSADSSAINQNIQQLVDAYNAVNKGINDQFAFNTDTRQQGVLAGDAALRGVAQQLRRELSAAGGIGAGITYLSDIGIKFQSDGSLTVDPAALSAALDENPQGVQNLFLLTQNGIGKRLPDIIDGLISSVDGSLTFRQKAIQSDIDRIDAKVAREADRIASYQDRLTQQFSALETLVSQLKSQGDYLTQQLAALNK